MAEVQHLVVMGVAGSGKTTVARILADRLARPLGEADEFHPPENVAKMAAGTPLTDDDRWPWLRAIRDWLTAHAREGQSTVVTCSALKVGYRDVLREAQGRVQFAHLAAPEALIEDRMGLRTGHFMPPELLPSQYRTLEPLTDAEDGFVVSVDVPPEAVAQRVLDALATRGVPS
ncbi:gluconokinase, GntK/IdnK-type [Cellulomonas sp. URHE0023]|uniref:gluconokinase n=1 Tax=Cellulomonas sp. URHE0023 TaxID=1380354 RepID=UPI000482524A